VKKKQRKRKKAQRKPWRPLKAWVPGEWAAMKEAWLRVYASLSNNMPLTKRSIRADLLAGDLVGAARVVMPDKTERWIIFDPEFWEPVELPYAWAVWGYEKPEGEEWDFFVRRRELDKRYPPAAANATPSEPRADDVSPRSRHTPGPKPTDDWPKELAAELIRIAVVDPKALQNVDKLATKIQKDFADTNRFLPQDPKRVREEIVLLLKHIR